MQFVVDLQVDHLSAALDACRQRIATPAQLLHSIGQTLLPVNQERQAQGLAPDGSKWAPLSPLTIGTAVWKSQRESFSKKGQMSLATARKVQAKKGRLLHEHGDLLRFAYQVQGDVLRLGTNDWKAAWHHFGTGTHGPRGASYTITPKKAKALAFAGMYRKRVNHPGIPARPLVGFPASDQQMVRDVAHDHLAAALHQAR